MIAKLTITVLTAIAFIGAWASKPQPAPTVEQSQPVPQEARQTAPPEPKAILQPPISCCGQLAATYTLTDATASAATTVAMNFVGMCGDRPTYWGMSSAGDRYVLVFCSPFTFDPRTDNTMIYMNVYPISSGWTTTSGQYTQLRSPFGNHNVTLQ